MKFMKFSMKVSLKYFNEIFTRQNVMKLKYVYLTTHPYRRWYA